MKKKFLPMLVLLLSFMLCFSFFDSSYADSAPPTTYTVRSNVTVHVGGSTQTKSCGRLNKGQKVQIIAFARNGTGSWWCKIARSTKNGKWVSTYKNKWIYSGAIDLPYKNKPYARYIVASEYSSVNVRKSPSSNSRKIGSIPRNVTITFKRFKKDSNGNVWGQIAFRYSTVEYAQYNNGWMCMKYMNFNGHFILPKKKNLIIRDSLSSSPRTTYVVNDTLASIQRVDYSNGKWWCRCDSYNEYSYRGKYFYLGSISSNIDFR